MDEAANCYQKALLLRPDYPEAHNNLGNVLKAQGQLDEASSCYQRALRLKPDFPEAYNNLGNALREQGAMETAVNCFQQALHLLVPIGGGGLISGVSMATSTSFTPR